MKKIIINIAICIMISTLLISCGNSKKDDNTIVIGHKNFTEQRILGEFLGIYFENELGLDTKVTELGGTMMCFQALKNGSIDLYTEYSGTAYMTILKSTEDVDSQDLNDYLKKSFKEEHNLVYLNSFGFNNTYVLSTRQDIVDKYNITKISDISNYPGEIIIGCNNEVADREDGLPGLKRKYGLEFKSEETMEQGLTYVAIANKNLDIVISFSTEGRIAKYNLVNLEDDKGFFMDYYIAPLLNGEFAESNPEVVKSLEKLTNSITEEDMQHYNYLVDEENTPIKEVAQQIYDDIKAKQ